jgi:hypothetical protein
MGKMAKKQGIGTDLKALREGVRFLRFHKFIPHIMRL